MHIEKLVDNINIIYDNRKNNEEIDIMIEKLQNADKIFFLGFGFDEDNLKVLNIPKCFNKNQKIYSTGYGLINEERNKISKIFHNAGLTINFNITDDDCLLLLRKYLKS